MLICSGPSIGKHGLVYQYLFTTHVSTFEVTISFATKAFPTSLPFCTDTISYNDLAAHLVLHYQELMTQSSSLPLFDLRKLNASLPVAAVSKLSTLVLVIGATVTFIANTTVLMKTWGFYGVHTVCVEGVAHDIWLDSSREKGAGKPPALALVFRGNCGGYVGVFPSYVAITFVGSSFVHAHNMGELSASCLEYFFSNVSGHICTTIYQLWIVLASPMSNSTISSILGELSYANTLCIAS